MLLPVEECANEWPQQRSSNSSRPMIISVPVSLTIRSRSAPPTISRPPQKINVATIRNARAGTRVLEMEIRTLQRRDQAAAK
jgi:hypothetical protein